MAQIYHNGNYLGNGTPAELIVKETVGWTGKNKCPRFSNYSQANVVFTVDNNGVVDITTTAAASANAWDVIDSGLPALENGKKYKVSGLGTSANQDGYIVGDNNGADYVYVHDEGSGGEFTYDSSKPLKKIQIGLRSGQTASHIKLSPMIRNAMISDDTYEPYHDTVKEEIEGIYADNGALGAKNLLPNNATSQTINGVTFTVNSDNGSITANGTASATAFLPIVPNNTMTIKKGSYILSAGDGIIDNYSKYGLYINGASGDIANTKTEEIAHFTLSADILVNECKIFVTSGTTVSNLTFYPMLRLASDPDTTYQPYAMTNRELTEKVLNLPLIPQSADIDDYKTTGKYYWDGNSPTHAPDTFCTLEVQHTDTYVVQICCKVSSSEGSLYVRRYRGSWSSWFKFNGTIVS